MATRAKFTCIAVTDNGNNYKSVKLIAAYSTSKEDNQFAAATPSGSLEMSLTNPDTIDFFKPGKAYYLDISEVSK